MRADAAVEASAREERMVAEIGELKRKLEAAEANGEMQLRMRLAKLAIILIRVAVHEIVFAEVDAFGNVIVGTSPLSAAPAYSELLQDASAWRLVVESVRLLPS